MDKYEHWNEEIEDFHRRTMNWTGTKKTLVIPLLFSDHKNRYRPSKSDIEKLFNSIGGDPQMASTGSVRDVFLASSYGKLDMVSDVMDWVQLSKTESYYADGSRGFTYVMHQAMGEALNYLENTLQLNFKNYDSDNDGLIDSICFLHSGYAAEWGGNSKDGAAYLNRIWSHKWALYGLRTPQNAYGWKSARHNVSVLNYHISSALWGTGYQGDTIGRVGVIAHETGHFLGITDLYDTAGIAGNGIGSWGLMANSWGFDNTQKCPPIMSPWSKMELGWLTPTVLSASGKYELKPSYNNAEVYQIKQGYPIDEYLLVEYRKPTGMEFCMPAEGLAIWHIDNMAGYDNQGWPGQAGWPGNGNHYRISLLQADGLYELEKDTNRGNAGDLYTPGKSIGPGFVNGAYVYPNTDSYQTGTIAETGISITNIKKIGTTAMGFDLTMPAPPVAAPVPAPVAPPVAAPVAPPVAAPVPAPVATPVASPVTGPTALSCGTQGLFVINIETDGAGAETVWEIQNASTGVTLESGSGYDNNKIIRKEVCLDRSVCYKLKITDLGGNGFSSGGGKFDAIYDGVLVDSTPGKTSTPFSSMSSDFGLCDFDTASASIFHISFTTDAKFFGQMFDVKGLANIVVGTFDAIHIDNVVSNNVKVYTKNGSYKGFENSPEYWTKVFDNTVVGKGKGKFTSLPEGFSPPVAILKDTVQAFYVVCDKPDLLYLDSATKSWKEGDVWRAAPTYQVLTGIQNEANFGPYSGPSLFNGRITSSNLKAGSAADGPQGASMAEEIDFSTLDAVEEEGEPLSVEEEAEVEAVDMDAEVVEPDTEDMQMNDGLGRDEHEDGFVGEDVDTESQHEDGGVRNLRR